MSKQQLLLIEDVDGLGRKGEVVSGAKPGFVRNFLLPSKKAVVADLRTLRMQERLQSERAQQAVIDKKAAEEVAKKIEDKVISIEVKVDQTGHMYGSVTAKDIVKILDENAITVERKMVILPLPIKKLGTYKVPLRLNEGVEASFSLNVKGENVPEVVEVVQEEQVTPEVEDEAPTEES
ncbi:MAG: 50S ribosomal protein L9 [Chlamydiia bacterium]|nr:50S ribosomal protein L9 [Chlamydiia bacterium]MCH9615130.1 50S ribosomal protein L9 [Chlamydiia bacterium]MCH9628548.1 50S ribosomal protein L9 [Chlamydiia bacterium]